MAVVFGRVLISTNSHSHNRQSALPSDFWFGFSAARNQGDREPALLPPLYAPKGVAYGTLYAAEHPKCDVSIGGADRFMSIPNRVALAMMDRFSKLLIRQPSPRRPAGALHQTGNI